jgi:hypothetical protein
MTLTNVLLALILVLLAIALWPITLALLGLVGVGASSIHFWALVLVLGVLAVVGVLGRSLSGRK